MVTLSEFIELSHPEKTFYGMIKVDRESLRTSIESIRLNLILFDKNLSRIMSE